MEARGADPAHEAARRAASLQALRQGPLAGYLEGERVLEIGPEHARTRPPLSPSLTVPLGEPPVIAPEASQDLVYAGYRLQDLPDYRGALQSWFRAVRLGGRLVVVVPHAFLYERQDRLPSRMAPEQKRLYTPASLLAEVEEALAPNSYRVRLLCDLDAGYDYARPRAERPTGRHEVALVLERIAPPAWSLADLRPPTSPGPDYGWGPERTRVEALRRPGAARILALKLDHVGDFILGRPALERLRLAFPEAEITLMVGSWNYDMALEMGLFDRIVAFDVFPRNSNEERPDVAARIPAFDAQATGVYDLAVDLRTDPDTRVLLRGVEARHKAGIGTQARFDFLDIFLPLDETRQTQFARDEMIAAREFSAQDRCRRHPFQIACRGAEAEGGYALVWGPYRELPVGDYVFEPLLEVDSATPGALEYDIALDARQGLRGVLRAGEASPALRLAFAVEDEGARFEFRLRKLDDEDAPDVRFFGGRLIKAGGLSVLHESESALLLVELVALRLAGPGLLAEAGAPA